MSKKVELIAALLRYTYVPLASWEYQRLEEKITGLRGDIKAGKLTPNNLEANYKKGRNLAKTNTLDKKYPFEVTAYRKVFPKQCPWAVEEILGNFFPEKQPVLIDVNKLSENARDSYFETDSKVSDDYQTLLEAKINVKQRQLHKVDLDWAVSVLDFLEGTIDWELKECLFNIVKLEYELRFIEPEDIIWYGQKVGKQFEKRFIAERIFYYSTRAGYYFYLGASLIKKYEGCLDEINEKGRDWVECIYQKPIPKLNLTLGDLVSFYD